MLISQFELFASYNQSMNKNIYHAVSSLPPIELSLSRGAYFDSIIGTLNHILVGDIIWLKRFADHPQCFTSLDCIREYQLPQKLDALLYPEFGSLCSVREDIDKTIQEFCSELDADILQSSLSYKNTKGILFKKNFGYLVLHLFNHQTHHRGQLSTLLNQINVDIGITDLLMNIPDIIEPINVIAD